MALNILLNVEDNLCQSGRRIKVAANGLFGMYNCKTRVTRLTTLAIWLKIFHSDNFEFETTKKSDRWQQCRWRLEQLVRLF